MHPFDDALIAKMKRGAYIVNTARGKICDRDAIARRWKAASWPGMPETSGSRSRLPGSSLAVDAPPWDDATRVGVVSLQQALSPAVVDDFTTAGVLDDLLDARCSTSLCVS